jgi:hypothetical protein
VVDGQPVARDDTETLMPVNSFYEGNVISGVGTDGGVTSLVTEIGQAGSSGADSIVDNAVVKFVEFRGIGPINLSVDTGSAVTGTDSEGVNYSYTVSGGRLTWTNTAEPANQLIFDSTGYYKYTPPASEVSSPTVGAVLTNNFTSSANADDNGVQLSGYTRTANLTQTASYAHAALTYAGTGVGIPTGETGGAVDDLETLVIVFDRTTYPRGVKNVTLNINAANSNLGSNQAVGIYGSGVVSSVNYSIFDISGNLIGQFASFAEGAITIPAGYSNIGRIELEASSPARARIQSLSFQSDHGQWHRHRDRAGGNQVHAGRCRQRFLAGDADPERHQRSLRRRFRCGHPDRHGGKRHDLRPWWQRHAERRGRTRCDLRRGRQRQHRRRRRG